jgi:hypothetical protein
MPLSRSAEEFVELFVAEVSSMGSGTVRISRADIGPNSA